MQFTSKNIDIGNQAPDIVNAVIEMPQGSDTKYEFDAQRNEFVLDRMLPSNLLVPLAYGFIPETFADDGDALDIFVIGDESLVQGSIVQARPIGVLKMIDDGKLDCKILTVQNDNQKLQNIQTLSDVGKPLLDDLNKHCALAKGPKNERIEILGWEDAKAAKQEIVESQKRYQLRNPKS